MGSGGGSGTPCARSADNARVRGGYGSRASLIVEDSGPGIPKAERSRLFDRFHRATEHGAGTGLGLAIGDSIVRSTGGRWQVGDSGLGGALMSVSWRYTQPRAVRPAERSAERDGVRPFPDGGT